MNKGEGVLIVNITSESQYHATEYTVYYSWNGEGEVENWKV